MGDITSEDLKQWAALEDNLLTREGYLLAAEAIDNLQKRLAKYERFVDGIKPQLAYEGYYGIVKGIDELQGLK